MKPVIHAQLSVHKYGGKIDDYLKIHEFIDISKAAMPDMRHRAVLHHAMGCYVVQETFGIYFENSEGRTIATRDIAEEHIVQDLGWIPTVQDYLQHMPMDDVAWVGGMRRKMREVPIVD